MNVRFEYLYRDAGNFKNWGDVVFSNDRRLQIQVLLQQARTLLIDGQYFVAPAVRLPELHFPEYNSTLDHEWHEMHALEPTIDVPSDEHGRDIEDFIEELRLTRARL